MRRVAEPDVAVSDVAVSLRDAAFRHSQMLSRGATSATTATAVAWLLACAFLANTGCRKSAAPTAADDHEAEIAPVSVTVAPVVTRPLQRRVSLVGTLHGFEKVVLTPKVEGRVQGIYGEVGDRVEPGKVLLELDDTDYALATDEAERALETELARLGLDEPPGDVFDADAQPAIVRATLLLENARRRFDRQKSLLSSAVATREAYEQIETELKVAEATVRQSRLEVQATLAAVRHRQAVLAQAKQRLSETKLAAPALQTGGDAPQDYVIGRRMAAIGEMVRAFPSTPVFELVIDGVLKLRATVPERYGGQLRIGQKVEVHVEAYPDETFAATVLRLNPTVDPQSRTFEIEALVPNADHRLKHGGFAKANVITREDDAALIVPLSAITSFAGVNKVFRVRDGRAEEVLTKVGIRGEGWVEVQADLAADDLVVTSGQTHLANQTPVKIRDTAE